MDQWPPLLLREKKKENTWRQHLLSRNFAWRHTQSSAVFSKLAGGPFFKLFRFHLWFDCYFLDSHAVRRTRRRFSESFKQNGEPWVFNGTDSRNVANLYVCVLLFAVVLSYVLFYLNKLWQLLFWCTSVAARSLTRTFYSPTLFRSRKRSQLKNPIKNIKCWFIKYYKTSPKSATKSSEFSYLA